MLRRGIWRARSSISWPLKRGRFRSSGFLETEQPKQNWQPLNTGNLIPKPNLDYDAPTIAMHIKQKLRSDGRFKRRSQALPVHHLREGSNEEILHLEVTEILDKSHSESVRNTDDNDGESQSTSAKHDGSKPPVDLFTEIELDIIELSSTGNGLALTPAKDHVVVVPFTVPGDRVLAKVYKWQGIYTLADFVKLVDPSKKREGTTPECQYFAKCGGCQLQMLAYEDQLAHKKTIVEKAFEKFSGLSPEKVPAVRDTMGSPLQYRYRTKLSPHFDAPRMSNKSRRAGEAPNWASVPRIGFNRKNTSEVMDIEHCPIGTDILQEGLGIERAKVAVNYKTYLKGKTILLRESTSRTKENGELDTIPSSSPVADFDTISEPTSKDLNRLEDGRPELTLTFPTHTDKKTYTSNENALSTEYIGPYKFTNRAGTFFQNNNSILGPFTKYVYDNCMVPTASSSTSIPATPPIKYLLDAYCGSGLFTITLSKLFSSALGIDIDPRGIEAARENADRNKIPNAGFIEADASDLFAEVPFPPDQSLVIIDPPRKGASADFLKQLCQFGAKRVIYVSCNVHTQARDVGMIVQGFGEGRGCRYEIESLRGFDFFPQTGHVEGVCVLNRVETDA